MSTVRPPATADTAAQLLSALERSGPNPALAWYGESSRIELSGHVLANWLIKSIGHLHEEIALAPDDAVVLDLPPHWKRLVLAVAAWALGAEVTVHDRGTDGDGGDGGDGGGRGDGGPPAGFAEPRVVITDRPDSQLARAADEVLAVQAVSLAPRYDGELPPLAHDWLAEVRGSPDQLGVVLPAWSGPAAHMPVTGSPPRLLVEDDGLDTASQVLGALLAGGGIVGPAEDVAAQQAQEESVTGRV
ncbi:TIGR03089 family protein [Brachybacterium sp. AOP43-C2-M15]|uniref:TIGR03089 family protein n=1 Tax=Brachybacterium sp. AOP43-C2-M15 TaxID=3457661 RepID=UPI0040336C2B